MTPEPVNAGIENMPELALQSGMVETEMSLCNNKDGHLDVLLILRANIDLYPPSRNQAELLVRRGLRVGVIDLSFPPWPGTELSSDVLRWQPHTQWDSKREAPRSLRTRLREFRRFRASCRTVIRNHKPSVVVGYDFVGCLHAPPRPQRYATVYHFHELFDANANHGWGSHLAYRKVCQRVALSDRLTISDEHRGRLLQEELGLPRAPHVIMNCPMKIANVPRSDLRKKLEGMGRKPKHVVVYVGSIGVNQGLFETAASMAQWPKATDFVLIGNVSHDVKDRIQKAAGRAGRAESLVFLGPRAHREAMSLAVGADIGVSLIQSNRRNLKYSAGAINKRFEYAALGLPQVTTDLPGVRQLFGDKECAVFVQAGDADGIGRGVARLLADSDLRRQYGRNARELHLSRLNYQAQFEELGDWIAARCGTVGGAMTKS